MKTVPVSLSVEEIKKVKQVARQQGRTLNGQIEKYIGEGLELAQQQVAPPRATK